MVSNGVLQLSQEVSGPTTHFTRPENDKRAPFLGTEESVKEKGAQGGQEKGE
jgi:hypothetical protein